MERIAELGELHPGRKPIQPPRAELRRFYKAARAVLKHPLLTFGDDEIERIGDSFAQVVAERKYTCYACAIMPDHVHALIRKHRDRAEAMIDHLQKASRQQSIAEGRRAPTHPVWGSPGWKVFLYRHDDFLRVSDYIRKNPVKAGRPPQFWGFVKGYDGWLPGQYAR